MATKIGSHRIAEKSINNDHLSDNLKLREDNELTLNYPTHSNQYDLSANLYQVLTQGGNADTLHYHTGGGGGDAGIYTNKQRDSMLLELMMLLHAQAYRLENSITDSLENADDIDLGVKPPVITELSEILSDTDDTSLEASTNYTYRVSQKFKGKTTMASFPVMKQTTSVENSVYRKMKVDVLLHPDNDGVKLWRAKNSNPITNILFDRNTELYSFDNLMYSIVPESAQPYSGGSLLIPYLGEKGASYREQSSPSFGGVNIGHKKGVDWNGALDEKVRFGYKNSASNYEIDKLTIVFGKNPNHVPISILIQYSKILDPNIENDSHWSNFTNLKYYSKDGVQPPSGTGKIIEGGKVIENTSRILSFVLDKVEITGIRITVLKHLGSFRYNSLRAEHKGNSVGSKIIQRFQGSSLDMSIINSLIIDVKSEENHNAFQIGLKDSTDKDKTSEETIVYNTTNTNKTLSPNVTRVCRTCFPITDKSYSLFEKIKIKFRKNLHWNTRLKNVTIGVSRDKSSIVYYPETLRNVTFNGGEAEVRSASGSSEYIESDYVEMKFPDGPVNYVVVSFTLAEGNLYGYGVDENVNTYYTYGEPSSEWDFDNNVPWMDEGSKSCYVHYVVLAKGYEALSFENIPEKNRKNWYTHYIDISSIKDKLTNIDSLFYVMKDVKRNGIVQFSNVRFSSAIEYIQKNKDTITPTATSSSENHLVEKALNEGVDDFWQSEKVPTLISPEIYMLNFSKTISFNRLRFTENEDLESYTFQEYQMQYSVSIDALVDDPIDSHKWKNFESLCYATQSASPDVGLIHENGLVKGANIHKEYLDHIFIPVSGSAVRIIVFRTKGNINARIRNLQLFTTGDDASYEVVFESNSKEETNFTFVDDKLTGAISPLPLENETGSENINYDSRLQLVKVFDKSKPARFLTKTIDVETFNKCLIRTQSIDIDNSITYEVSNDAGETWVPVIQGTIIQMQGYGNKFKLRAFMLGDDQLSAYAVLYTM